MDMLQATLLKLRQNYIGELPDRLDEIERLILNLEHEGYRESIFDDLYRHVHSLKGSGGTHGIHIITLICHPLEDYLGPVAKQHFIHDANFADISLCYVDLLKEVQVLLETGNESFGEIERKLLALRKRAFPSSYSALIVETSSVITSLLSDTLRSYNFRTVVMNDGYVALGRALNERFDILISGFEIKQLNGVALIGALKLVQGLSGWTKTMLLTTDPDTKLRNVSPDFVIAKDDNFLANIKAAVEATLSVSK